MEQYERREPILPDFYKELGISYSVNGRRLSIELNQRKEEALMRSDKQLYEYIQLAEEYLLERREEYDKYLKRRGVKFSLTKKEKRKKLVRRAIITGLIVAVGLGSTYYISEKKAENLNSNVCVEYVVQEGDTLDELREKYGLRDISMSYLAISGSQRQTAAYNCGQDIYDFIAEDDVIEARTTMEKADRFVEDKGAEKKSIEEVMSSLDEENAVGEFGKATKGISNFDFYNPTVEKTLG